MKEFRKTEDGLFICEECGKICKNKQGLSTHISNNYNAQKYFDKWLKEDNEELCKVCNKETKFNGLFWGYKKCCSKKCICAYTYNRIKEENLKKYGMICILHTIENKKKVKETCLKHFGVEYSFQQK